MKKLFVSLPLLSALFLFSCFESPITPPLKSDLGSASISIMVGKVGALGKIRNIELSKLYIALTALGETSIYDTVSLSGNSGATISKTYSNLASLLKTWTLTAESRDIDGAVIHSGSTQFIVPARNTIPVTLNLNAKYSMLKANFFPIRDSVTRCELLVNGTKMDDSSFAKQALLGDTVKLSYNYLDTGVFQRIKLNVYGTMWGFDTLLYSGDTLVSPVSGANVSYNIVLKWVGPALPPTGQASMSVTLGAVGSISVNGELQNTVTDIDGNVYHTVTIGTQTWMVENLKTTRLNDGTVIPMVSEGIAWGELFIPGYCWYNNDVTYKNIYGALYHWYAANSNKLAPVGWHVPSDAEWTTLSNYLGSGAGGKLKETGFDHWISPNIGATNETGFTALPGGFRHIDHNFYSLGDIGRWWSSTGGASSDANEYRLYSGNAEFYRAGDYRSCGLSIRLLKD